MVASLDTIVSVTQTYCACMCTLLVWDWLCLLPTEVRTIWKGPFNLNKLLYLISRYWAMANLCFLLVNFSVKTSYDTCRIISHMLPATGAVTALTSSAILALRTYAICGRPRWLVWLLVLFLFLELASLASGSVLTAPVATPGTIAVCLPRSKYNNRAANFVYFAVPAFVDTTLTIICVVKAVKLSKFRQSLISEAMTVFVRNGLVYFVICSLVWIVEAAFYLQPIKEIQPMNASATIALSSVMACRLVLSMRSVSYSVSTAPSAVFDASADAPHSLDWDSRPKQEDPSPSTRHKLCKACRGNMPSVFKMALCPSSPRMCSPHEDPTRATPAIHVSLDNRDDTRDTAVSPPRIPSSDTPITYLNSPAGLAVARDFIHFPRPVFDKDVRRDSDISLYA